MKFESLEMWKLAQQHYLTLDEMLKSHKEYYLKDQILRASLSISNNIAEGAESGTQQEFIRFLYIAKGSCAETRNMIYLLESKGIATKDVLLIS